MANTQQRRGRIQAQMSRDLHKGKEDTPARRKQRLALGKKAAKNLIEGTMWENRRKAQTTDSNN